MVPIFEEGTDIMIDTNLFFCTTLTFYIEIGTVQEKSDSSSHGCFSGGLSLLKRNYNDTSVKIL
jgi:hypothetical protein